LQEVTYVRDESKPKGLIFFVNIENIMQDDGSIQQRKGSERDWKNIKRLEGLGYDFFQGGLKDLQSIVSF